MISEHDAIQPNSAGMIIIDTIDKNHIWEFRIALIEMFGWKKQPGEELYDAQEFLSREERFLSGKYEYSLDSNEYILQFAEKLTFPKGTRDYLEDIDQTARREILEELLIAPTLYTTLPYDIPLHQRETGQSKKIRKENSTIPPDIKYTKLYLAELDQKIDVIKPDADFENEIKRAVWVPWWIGESVFKYEEDSAFYREHIQPVIEKHLQTKGFFLE